MKKRSNSSCIVVFLTLLFAFFWCCPTSLQAQKKILVSGYVLEAESSEDLIGAIIQVENTDIAVVTNTYGYYALSLLPGSYRIQCSFLGLQESIVEVNLIDSNVALNFELASDEDFLQEVVVTGEREDENVSSTDLGVLDVETSTVKKLPALFGEADILRTLQLMPGVMSSGEGNSGLYVRGSGPDQNLVLLDNATVYNPGHLLGFFSVFNSDAIKSTKLIKGTMPSEYGGRISSVLDVSMREGNMQEFHAEGGIGAIASRFTVEGPLKKEKASFLISNRITYLPYLINPVLSKQGNSGRIPSFFDVNIKINAKLSDKDRLFISSYIGRDRFAFGSSDGDFNFEIPWGNTTATMRWNHQFKPRLFLNTTLVFNDYISRVNAGFQTFRFKLQSGIRDYGVKGHFDYYPSVRHNARFGYEYMFHRFTPYQVELGSGEEDFTNDLDPKWAHEGAIYFRDEWDATSWWKLNIGLRASLWSNVGPGDRIYYDEVTGLPIDTVSKGRNEAFATYYGLEPRISMRFLLNPMASIKCGTSLNRQYMHLVSQSTTTLPTDLWVPSTERSKPQTAVQGSIGYFQNFKDNAYEMSVEGYYRRLWNQIEYAEGANDDGTQETEDQFVYGDGYAYGAEFFVKKRYGKFNGWVGYTLSWSERRFDDINNGMPFRAKFDRRHDASVVVMYDVNEKWDVSATWVYGSGQNTTLPVQWYFVGGEVTNVYGPRNDYRMAAYHRLDLSATMLLRDDEKRYSAVSLSVYNAYNRYNPYFIYYDFQGDLSAGDLEVSAKQASLFPILFTGAWNFKF